MVTFVSLVTFDACDIADRGRSKLALPGRIFPAKCGLGVPAGTWSRENESIPSNMGLSLLSNECRGMCVFERSSGERNLGEELLRMRRGHTDVP